MLFHVNMHGRVLAQMGRLAPATTDLEVAGRPGRNLEMIFFRIEIIFLSDCFAKFRVSCCFTSDVLVVVSLYEVCAVVFVYSRYVLL